MTALHQHATDITGAEVPAAHFRHAIGHFATGVTVITSVGADGNPVGTTANAVTSLSLDPPLVLVCFDRESQTLNAVRAHGAFVVTAAAAVRQLRAARDRGCLARGAAPPGPHRQPAA
jgi:flavin reductase (DIM6/NTAB) family NADH-FMN oxidoreductase RutF